MVRERRMKLAAVLLALLVWSVGCAGGNEAPPSNDVSEPDMPASDMGAVEDMAEPEPDLAGDPDLDTEPDLTPDLMEDPDVMEEPDLCGPTCCPGERRCADALTAEACNEDGSAWEPSTCSGGAMCVNGGCIVQCEPGSSRCLDGQTLQTCDVSGASYTTRRCATGVCLADACQDGELNGQPCEADDACAGGECLCRGEEVCPEVLANSIGAAGYCTVTDCSVSGCGQDEVCVDFSRSGTLTGRPVCIKRCFDCIQPGFLCRELPVLEGESLIWADGCFPADYPLDTSGRCSTDADCLGGVCLGGDLGDGGGYCTLACQSNEECPANAACLPFGEEGNFCARHCGDGTPNSGSCPINRGTFTTCRTREDLEGSLTFVCLPR